jgi:hypothetical protein
VTTHAPRDLADAQAHFHHAAQAASLLKAEVAVSLSHGDPGHSRWRTWYVNLINTFRKMALSYSPKGKK